MRKFRPSLPTAHDLSPALRERKMRPQTPAAKRPTTRGKRYLKRQNDVLGPGLAVIAGRTAGVLSRSLHLGSVSGRAGTLRRHSLREFPNI